MQSEATIVSRFWDIEHMIVSEREWCLCWSSTYPDQIIPQRAGAIAKAALLRHSETLFVFPNACWGAALMSKIFVLTVAKLNDVDQVAMHRATAGKTQK